MSTKTILVTGGRSLAALELAKVFSNAGHRVVCVESQKAPVCRFSSCVKAFYQIAPPALAFDQFVANLNRVIAQEKVTDIVPTCEEIFYISKAKDRLLAPAFCDSFKLLDRLHNKWSFHTLLNELGLKSPRTHLYTECPVGPGKWVLKPAYSRFGTQVQFVEKDWPEIEGSLDNPLIVQEFVSGEVLCSYSVCHEGQIASHAVYRPLHKMGRGAAICIKSMEHPNIDAFVKHFVSRTNFTGQISFDFIEGDSLYCLECNPRATSGVHLFNDQKGLASSFFESQSVCRPKKNTLIHDHLCMLWFGLKQKEVFKRPFWRHLRFGTNPLFAKEHRRVLFALPLILYHIVKETLFKGKKFQEMMTDDMAYNGDVL